VENAAQFQVLLEICCSGYFCRVLPAVDGCWQYPATGVEHLPGGLSLWLACRCGTCCQTTLVIRQSAATHSGYTWRRFYSHVTNACSTSEVSRWCAI